MVATTTTSNMAICYCGRTDYESTQESTIQCANCKSDVHIECANLPPYEVPNVLTFYCQYCTQTMGPTQMKGITNYHRNDRHESNPINNAVEAGTSDFICYLKNSTELEDSKPGDVRKMRGQQLSIKDLIESGFEKPILVESKDGLDMSCPIEPSTPIESLAQYYDQDIIEAFETTRQKSAKYRFANLLAQFAPMYSAERQNIFSFRINLFRYKPKRVTKIDDGRPVRPDAGKREFLPPRIVQKLSWVDSYWPVAPSRPELSKFLFVSMANSFVQFHIDVGACASWHHVLRGEQVYYLAEPTAQNLQAFRQWSTSPLMREEMFFRHSGVQRIYKHKVSDGETIFIPNGWIYAVLSMEDCVVFGGYFLHSLSMAKQIEVYDFLVKIEKDEKLNLYTFPAYEFTNWYAAPNVIKLVKQMQNQLPRHLCEGIEALVEKLKFWLKKSKSKRGDNTQYVPTCVECPKIIRDLNACLSKSGTANRPKGGLILNLKKPLKRPISSSEFVQDSDDDGEEHDESDEQHSDLDDEERPEPIKKIKDLLSTTGKNDKGGLNLKMKLNINKFQDVIRQTAEKGRGYDQNPFGTKKKVSKREKMEQAEIAKIMKESQGEDDQYVYMGDSAKASSKLRPDDSVWKPGTSLDSGPVARKSTVKDSSQKDAKPFSTPFVKPIVASVARLEPTAKPPANVAKPEKEKKPKKGLATVKQRLAKKLKL